MRLRWAWQIATADETLYSPSRKEVEKWAEGLDVEIKRVKVLSSKPLKRWTLRQNR